MPKSVFATALIATAALAFADGAFARDASVSSRVYYGDINLSTPRGARHMLNRIEATVEELCSPSLSPAIVPPQRQADNARCRLEATRRAVAALNAPLVTAEFDNSQAHRKLVATGN